MDAPNVLIIMFLLKLDAVVVKGNIWLESNGDWYYISSEAATFKEAEDKCVFLNGHITHLDINARPIPFTSKVDYSKYFVGLYFDEIVNKFVWLENGLIDDNENFPYNPDKGKCVVYYRYREGRYNVLQQTQCHNMAKYVCKVQSILCDTLQVEGFNHQRQLNVHFFRVKEPTPDCTQCRDSYSRYVTELRDTNTMHMVCSTDGSYRHKHRFYQINPSKHQCTNYAAYFYSKSKYPYPLSGDVEEYSTDARSWRPAHVQITCLKYNEPVMFPETYPLRPPTMTPTLSVDDSDTTTHAVLKYMNISIWMLVCVFIVVDTYLLLRYRKLKRHKSM